MTDRPPSTKGYWNSLLDIKSGSLQEAPKQMAIDI